MACVDVKFFTSYIGAALPVFTHSHDCEYCHSSLLPRHGAAIASVFYMFIAPVDMFFPVFEK